MNSKKSFAMGVVRRSEVSLGIANAQTVASPAIEHRFSTKTGRYLQSLQFGFIKDNFEKMQNSSAMSRRARFLMVVAPVVLGGAFGTVHYLRQSFAVYLKY